MVGILGQIFDIDNLSRENFLNHNLFFLGFNNYHSYSHELHNIISQHSLCCMGVVLAGRQVISIIILYN